MKTGSPTVRISFYKTKKVSDEKAKEKGIKPEKAFIAYHLECYKEQHSAWLDNWFIQHPRVKKPRGRPKKYRDGKEAHRLKVRIKQNKEAGNTDKVQELEYLLEGLRID